MLPFECGSGMYFCGKESAGLSGVFQYIELRAVLGHDSGQCCLFFVSGSRFVDSWMRIPKKVFKIKTAGILLDAGCFFC